MSHQLKILRGITLLLLFSQTPISAQIINVEDRRLRLGDSVHWLGKLDVGLNIYQNEKQFITASLGSQVEFKDRKHFVLTVMGYNMARNAAQNILNDGFQHIRYNYDIKEKIVWELFEQVQYNERIRLRLRAVVGTGLRFKIFRQPTKRLYVGISYFYEQTRYKDEITPQFNHRLSTYIAFSKPFGNNSRLVSTTYFQPIITHFQSYRMASDNSLLFKINKHLSFRSNINVTFDNDTRLPPSVPDLIYTWSNGLRIDF